MQFTDCSFKIGLMRVWYFGYFPEWYPRNRVIRKGLAKAGAQLLTAVVPPQRLWRWPRLLLKAAGMLVRSGKPTVLIVPEVDLESFPLAWILARLLGALLVYDAFYSRWDALVNDEKESAAGSLKARLTRFLEKFAISRADLCLADSDAHAEYIAELYQLPKSKFETVYIGADDELFHPLPAAEAEKFIVHYNGFYHRLQGAPAIIEAAALLKDEGIEFEMVGKRASPAFKEVMDKVEKMKPPNLTFVDTMPIDQMPGRMARAAVCLGIFGKTGFGERVFPNKGFQTLAMGIPLITRESRGAREVGNPGEHFLTVPAEDGKALAEAILFLKNNPEKRKAIARSGLELFLKRFAPEPVGRALLGRLEQELKARGKL